jgi:DNA-binding NtrC family response regulator
MDITIFEENIDFLSHPDFIANGSASEEVFSTSSGKVYDKVIGTAEKQLIKKALERSFGNQSIAAKLLGISRNTLRLKIKKLDINVSEYKI